MSIRKINGVVIDADTVDTVEGRWTYGKLREGRGTGTNPVEIDLPINIAWGSYTGDDANNKAIAHGLGQVPLMVLIMAKDYSYVGMIAGTKCITLSSAPASGDVTDWDDTNFYIENTVTTLNLSPVPYSFVAIGT